MITKNALQENLRVTINPMIPLSRRPFWQLAVVLTLIVIERVISWALSASG